jgi:hypothetical protein
MPEPRTPAKTLSSSDFIRQQPASLSATEVIAKGKAEGIEIGSSLVYMVRGRSSGKAKRAATKTATSAPTSSNGARPVGAASTTTSSAEDLLRAVAAEIGLGRAVEILVGERARVRAMIGG